MRKVRTFCFIFTIGVILLTLLIVKRIKQSDYINSVEKVNDILQRRGSTHWADRCAKLKVKTKEECNEYDMAMSARHTDVHLSRQLEDCSAYITHTRVSFHPGEKKTPLAFSILAHRDAVQLSRST